MKRFLNKLLILAIPFCIIMVFFILIDPYNYFSQSNFIDNQYKITSINRSVKSMPRGNMLWKIIEYKRHPAENVIIGDSRAFDIDTRIIDSITGEEYYNLAVPGGNYNSLVESFWYVTDNNSDLKKVYLQVGFHNYNLSRDNNLFKEANQVRKNPIYFIFEFKYTCDAYYTLQHYLTKKKPNHFSLTGKAFQKNWNTVLKQQVRMPISNYTYPEDYKKELQKISKYCKKNNIEL